MFNLSSNLPSSVLFMHDQNSKCIDGQYFFSSKRIARSVELIGESYKERNIAMKEKYYLKIYRS